MYKVNRITGRDFQYIYDVVFPTCINPFILFIGKKLQADFCYAAAVINFPVIQQNISRINYC